MEEKKIIEINGIKMEIDMRTAKASTIDTFKVGDAVKVLIKKYSDEYTSHAGVIVGFDQFKDLPTIIVAYLDVSYSSADMKYVYINSASKEVQVCPMNGNDVPFIKSNVLELMDREILSQEQKLDDLKRKKEYFLKQFGIYFKNIEEVQV